MCMLDSCCGHTVVGYSVSVFPPFYFSLHLSVSDPSNLFLSLLFVSLDVLHLLMS